MRQEASVVVGIMLLASIAGCTAPAPPTITTSSHPDLKDPGFILQNHTGSAVLKIVSSGEATCSLHMQALVSASEPQLIWAYTRVPTEADYSLELRGAYITRDGVNILGERPLNAPPVTFEDKLNVSFEILTFHGATYFVAWGNLRAPLNQSENSAEVSWSCDKSDALQAAGWGTEMLAVFTGSMNTTVGADIGVPERVEVAWEGKAIKAFTSPQVQLIYHATGNRAGILRIMVEGREETQPMQSYHLFERHGGPGSWGLKEDGAHTISLTRYGFVFGTSPLPPSNTPA